MCLIGSCPSREVPRGHLGGDRNQSVSTVLLVSRVRFGSAGSNADVNRADIGRIVGRIGIRIIWESPYGRPYTRVLLKVIAQRELVDILCQRLAIPGNLFPAGVERIGDGLDHMYCAPQAVLKVETGADNEGSRRGGRYRGRMPVGAIGGGGKGLPLHVDRITHLELRRRIHCQGCQAGRALTSEKIEISNTRMVHYRRGVYRS